MIKHIVMWKFKENTEKEMNEFLDGLKALENQIDVIKSMQVGKNIDNDEYDFLDFWLVSSSLRIYDQYIPCQPDRSRILTLQLCPTNLKFF